MGAQHDAIPGPKHITAQHDVLDRPLPPVPAECILRESGVHVMQIVAQQTFKNDGLSQISVGQSKASSCQYRVACGGVASEHSPAMTIGATSNLAEGPLNFKFAPNGERYQHESGARS